MRGNELNSIERTLSPENKENKYIMNSIDRHGSSVNECSEISNTINLENQKNMTLCRSNSQIVNYLTSIVLLIIPKILLDQET